MHLLKLFPIFFFKCVNSCYHKSKIKLPERRSFLPYLKNLMIIINAPVYRSFKQNIHSDNNAISLPPMGTKLALMFQAVDRITLKCDVKLSQKYSLTSSRWPTENF